MSAPAWYCETDGGSLGPLAASELKELARSGRLKPTDRVRKEGMTSWATAAQVKGLFASQGAVSPPGGAPAIPSEVPAVSSTAVPAQDPNPPQRPTGDLVRPSAVGMGTTSVFEPIERSRTLLTSRKRNGSELVRLLAGQSRWFVIALALVLIGGLWLFLRRGSTPHKIAGVDHPVPQAQVRERTKSAADALTKASRDLTEQITHEAIQSRRENPTVRPEARSRQKQSELPAVESNEGLPHEFTNSLAMKLLLIPGGEFFMGTSPKEPNTIADEHRDQDWPTRLTKPFFVSIHEVTQADYEAIIGRNPSMFKGKPRNPVEMVSWGEAVEFCQKLTQKEGLPYRLPTEAEWEYMCRGGTTTRWYFGNDPTPFGQHAWCFENAKGRPHPVGLKQANQFGIYDLYGNVFEWCQDWYAYRLPNSSLTSSDLSLQARLNKLIFDPAGPKTPERRWKVIRGGSFLYKADRCRSSRRDQRIEGNQRHSDIGFRVVIDTGDRQSLYANDWVTGRKKPPGQATQSDDYVDVPRTIISKLGVKLAWIPAGEFFMGTPKGERLSSRQPPPAGEDQHPVTISKPFYIGVYEVTQEEYARVMGTNPVFPGRFRGPKLPVGYVSWSNAIEFCRKLSEKEGNKYRLPTEAEWEYVCRAGTTTPFQLGDSLSSDDACFKSDERLDHATQPVGTYRPNRFGVYDMHGNVAEWCSDAYEADYYASSPRVDPQGPQPKRAQMYKVLRGGHYDSEIDEVRSAARKSESSGGLPSVGFRVVMEE